MSKPVLYLFNGKVAKVGNSVLLGTIPPPPPPEDVQIGTQIWKIKNLAIDDGGSGIKTRTVTYDSEHIVTEYYYTWAAAQRIVSSISGWHIPTIAEAKVLVDTFGGNGSPLRSTYGWNNGNGTNSTGFTALPAGYYSYDWLNANDVAEFRLSDIDPYLFERGSLWLKGPSTVSVTGTGDTVYLSVRLIKDS